MKRFQFRIVALLLSVFYASTCPSSDAGIFDDPAVDDFTPASSCSSADRFWIRSDYLLWQTTGMKLPPLVTSNPLGTAAGEAGVIGIPSTTVIAGGNPIFDSVRSGVRWNGGMNVTERFGFEGDFFFLADEEWNARYDGNARQQILGRPIINLAPLTGPVRYDTQLVHFPPTTEGYIDIRAYSEFYGGGFRGRFNFFGCGSCNTCDGGCDGGCDGCCVMPKRGPVSSFALTMGYRHLSLGEGIRIDEHLEDTVAPNPTEVFDLYDEFSTSSRFHGIELGGIYNCWCGNYGLNLFGNIAAGNNHNEVRINGQTTIDNVVQATPGGLLTQTSNIGSYSEDVAALSTQFGFNVNALLMPGIQAHVGYSGMYWGNVARAGEQIDMNVHPGLFPNPTAPVGTIGARPTGALSDYFAHGLNLGLTFTR